MIEQHARDIVAVMSRLASRGSSLSFAALAGAQRFEQWRHYPLNDAVDAVHGTEFYYHAHGDERRAVEEHGHFHVFARTQRGKCFHHLVAISLNTYGMPTRLFLTNQWVTGEAWVDSRAIRPLLASFVCDVSGKLAPVARWVTGMVHLYTQEIEALHRERDRWFTQQMTRVAVRDKVLSSKRHQVVAKKAIRLPARLARIQ